MRQKTLKNTGKQSDQTTMSATDYSGHGNLIKIRVLRQPRLSADIRPYEICFRSAPESGHKWEMVKAAAYAPKRTLLGMTLVALFCL